MQFYNDLFKIYRESKCLTLEEIGKRVGVTKPTVQKWESGAAKPRPQKVYALAKVLGISVVDISDLRPENWLTDPAEHEEPVASPEQIEIFRRMAMDAVMALPDLNAEGKILVYNLLKNLKVEK